MQRIALNKASPGMVVAQDICRPDGLVLLKEGQTLTDVVIERARNAGVTTVCIERDPQTTVEHIDTLQVLAEVLPHMFRRHTENAFMMALRDVFTRHFAKRLAEKRTLKHSESNREASPEKVMDARQESSTSARRIR